MTIFVDTNVILDWLLDRDDTFADEATSLFLTAEENQLTIYISGGSVYTVAYVLHRAGKRGQKLRDALMSFLNLVQIAGTDKNTFILASQLMTIADLEDGFQYQTALASRTVQYFVTGNIKDFRLTDQSRLPVVTPAEMITILGKL
ncbi:type II toxin-antitoxin system VapC family toxin [Spirosoma utsteinense]|uniref:Nucleic acid-binding protein n=1 Tax=Spirosoma utsteinense TaxID=2585773 RepID=A0ABR6W6S7_9BACT|nr:PIN domain-containing protein [Spirosoma utsteinense]MBC3786303.1 putative nucleic acid-binding protein [Spirosoma utsteinense]MBC3791929.1 putative nucleic acid-binding protein [Spirosoma utsteinense]